MRDQAQLHLQLGTLTVHVTTNGCEYTYAAEKEIASPPTDEYEGPQKLDCPAGKEMTTEITEGGTSRCTIHVAAQNTIKPVKFRNMTTSSPTDITIETVSAVVKAKFTAVKTGSLLNDCGLFVAGSEMIANTKYSGNTTVEGRDTEGRPIDLQIN